MALSALSVTVGTSTKEIDVSTLTLAMNGTGDVTTAEFGMTLSGTDMEDIKMWLSVSGGTWSVKKFEYGVNRVHNDHWVSAYDGKSFGCVSVILRRADSDPTKQIHIVIADIQMQPLFNAAADVKLEKFSDRWNDCTGFFSAGIWGALFVVILLVSILSVGLTMIMDIKTMDRFDDPKGKTITINAQE